MGQVRARRAAAASPPRIARAFAEERGGRAGPSGGPLRGRGRGAIRRRAPSLQGNRSRGEAVTPPASGAGPWAPPPLRR